MGEATVDTVHGPLDGASATALFGTQTRHIGDDAPSPPNADLYSVKAGYAGMNVQIACSMDGDLVAVGPVPIPGARHDAHAYAASGLKDLGYVGVDLVPYKRLPGRDLRRTTSGTTPYSPVSARPSNAPPT